MSLLDKDIREPLFEYLEQIYGKSRIFEEKNMGYSRADVVMVVSDAIYGIEIKSDSDTYTRLATQVPDYDKYFDFNIIVVGSTHALHVGEHVPDYWGIISVEETESGCDFYYFREPKPNPKRLMKHKLEILWRYELALLQEWNEMAAYKQKSKAFVREKILENVPEKLLQTQISDILFERDYTLVAQRINEYRLANGYKPRKRRKYKRRKRNNGK